LGDYISVSGDLENDDETENGQDGQSACIHCSDWQHSVETNSQKKTNRDRVSKPDSIRKARRGPRPEGPQEFSSGSFADEIMMTISNFPQLE
jgi:hypothetical protein